MKTKITTRKLILRLQKHKMIAYINGLGKLILDRSSALRFSKENRTLNFSFKFLSEEILEMKKSLKRDST
jgi:hypothetical protein